MADDNDQLIAAEVELVNALLLPLVYSPLLVPMSAVAEVANADLPLTPLTEENECLYGWISWRDQHIPLLSFDSIAGTPRPALSSASRIAILNAVGVAAESGFYALVLQGYPRPVKMSSAEDNQAPTSLQEVPGALFKVTISGEEAIVPDFDYLEAICRDAPEP